MALSVSRLWAWVWAKVGVGSGKLFLVSYIAYASLYSVRKPFSVVKTDIQKDLGVSTYWLGLIDTTFLGAYAFGQFFIPLFLSTTSIESANLLLFLYSGSGLMSIAFGLTSDWGKLAFFWSLNGLLNSAVFPILIEKLSTTFNGDQRGRILGSWTTSQQIGATIATVLAAYIGHNYSWRSAFILPGVFILFVGLSLKMLWREITPEIPKQWNSEPQPVLDGNIKVATQTLTAAGLSRPSELETTNSGIEMQRLPRTPRKNGELNYEEEMSPKPKINNNKARDVIMGIISADDVKAVAMSYFFIKCVRYSLMFWLPYYLATSLEYSMAEAGYASVMFDVGGFFGGLTAGLIADRMFGGQRLSVAAIACSGSAVSLVIFNLASHQSRGGALFLMGIVGFFNSGADSLVGGSASSDLCERAALPPSFVAPTSGIVNGIGSLGSVLQGYFTAHISEAFGWGALYYCLSGSSLLGAVFLTRASWHEYNYRKRILAHTVFVDGSSATARDP